MPIAQVTARDSKRRSENGARRRSSRWAAWPEEDTMKRNPHTPAARSLGRLSEVYCRRDNRVYAVCPHVAAGSRCRCLSEVETADALFESETPEPELGH